MRKIFVITALLLFAPALRGGEEFVFFVREGDSARSLTENYLVRPTAWERVVQYNYILKPGNLIRVPPDLVRREERAFLEFVSGEVSFIPAGGREWIPAIDGLILQDGDRVRTGPEGNAVVRTGLEDRAVLRSATEVIYEPTRGFLAGRTNRLTIVEGTVIASTRKMEDREARFVLKAPGSELDLVGTELRIRVSPGGETRFEVLDGEITVKAGREKYTVPAEMGLLMGLSSGARGGR